MFDPLPRWNELRWRQLNELDNLRQRLDGLVHSSSHSNDAAPAQDAAEFKEGPRSGHRPRNAKATPRQVEMEAAAAYPIPSHHYCSSGWGINE